MDCTTQIEGNKGIVKLNGRFTFDAAAPFKIYTNAVLSDPKIAELHLDFSEVTYMESSALGVLLLLREKAEIKGVKVVLLKPIPAVQATLDVVRFGKIFEIRG
ncbi:MAG: STAS domain-containing protein [Holophaga sp.]|nr:STAS domain-containing protein [Holophaga sp.]